MARRVIFFNGPPRSGKDTAVNYLAGTRLWGSFKMSQPLKDAARAFFDISPHGVKSLEAIKDEPLPELFDDSYRKVQISLSEDWAKPRYGADVFGKLAARRVSHILSPVALCSDSGFAEEAEPILRQIGRKNALLVRLHRSGHTFTGDSRSYITLPDVVTVDLQNHTSMRMFQQNLDTVVDAWLSRLEN